MSSDDVASFLAELSTHSSVTNMDVSNLATVFAPTLMHARDTSDPGKFLLDVGLSTLVVAYLIEDAVTKYKAQQLTASASTLTSSMDMTTLERELYVSISLSVSLCGLGLIVVM